VADSAECRRSIAHAQVKCEPKIGRGQCHLWDRQVQPEHHQTLELTCSACVPSAQRQCGGGRRQGRSCGAAAAAPGAHGGGHMQCQRGHRCSCRSRISWNKSSGTTAQFPGTMPSRIRPLPLKRQLGACTGACAHQELLILALYRSFGGGGGQAGALRQERPYSGPVLRVTLQQREHRSSEDAGSPQQLLGPCCILPGQQLLSHNLSHHLHSQQPLDSYECMAQSASTTKQ
jgi:hypothetical protein